MPDRRQTPDNYELLIRLDEQFKALFEQFKALDKKRAKEILNIGTEETVIAFGAVSIDSSRKGWAYLQKALEILHEKKEFEKVLVLIFGSGNNSKMAAAIPFKVKFMGYLKDEYSKVLVYNAADVFIVAKHDSINGAAGFASLVTTRTPGENTG